MGDSSTAAPSRYKIVKLLSLSIRVTDSSPGTVLCSHGVTRTVYGLNHTSTRANASRYSSQSSGND
eukprot:9471410-Pyramimonas_sp.AAC.1